MSKDTKIKDTIRVVVDYLDEDLKEKYFAKDCVKSEGAIPKSRESLFFWLMKHVLSHVNFYMILVYKL